MQVQAPNRHVLLRSRDAVVSDAGKGTIRCQVSVEKMSESEPSRTHREVLTALSKPRPAISCGISPEDTCLLSGRQSVYRRHDLNTGDNGERGNLARDAKGNDKRQTPQGRIPMLWTGADLPVVAMSDL